MEGLILGMAVLAAAVSDLKERHSHSPASREEVVVEKKSIERKTPEEIDVRMKVLDKEIEYLTENLEYLHKITREITVSEHFSLMVEITRVSEELFKDLRSQIGMLECGPDREHNELQNGLLTFRLKALWHKAEKMIILYGRTLSVKRKGKDAVLISTVDSHHKEIESITDARYNAFSFFEERTLFLVEALFFIGVLEEEQKLDLRDEVFKKYQQISSHMHAARFISDTEIIVDRSRLEQ